MPIQGLYLGRHTVTVDLPLLTLLLEIACWPITALGAHPGPDLSHLTLNHGPKPQVLTPAMMRNASNPKPHTMTIVPCSASAPTSRSCSTSTVLTFTWPATSTHTVRVGVRDLQ